ncbi:MAG: hypothetical protein U0Z70_14885 [Thermomicrobiales bacterium]|nr:hypothetical protein [Chloroflexia bacterium]
MSEHFDDLTRTVAERTTRRSAVAGLGTLALGALTLAGLGQSAEAKQDNACKQCKRKCKRNNRKPGKKNKTNCNKKCDNRCKNT